VLPVSAGFQAVRVEGSGTHRVSLRYQPPQFTLYAMVSLGALGPAACIVLAAFVAWVRSHVRGQAVHAVTR
jgi:hypothetical protein